MKILLDADGSPVRDIVVELAKTYNVSLVMVSNIHHEINETYGTHIQVDSGADVADHEILKRTEEGDLVVTQDYGLASLVLGKKAYALHQDGWFYTDENIDMLLFQRHMGAKMRKANKRYGHTNKRKKEDNTRFKKVLEDLLEDETAQ
ncbi:MAG: YaiI/YqxD family protein [Bacillota bacterium]